MKVKEFIKELEKLPQNLNVQIEQSGTLYSNISPYHDSLENCVYIDFGDGEDMVDVLIDKLTKYLKGHVNECNNMEDLYTMAEDWQDKNDPSQYLNDYGIHQLTEEIADDNEWFLDELDKI